MKKFTIIGIMIFALGATAFARGHQNNMHSGSTYCGSGVNQTGFKRSPEMERSKLVIDEKKLDEQLLACVKKNKKKIRN